VEGGEEAENMQSLNKVRSFRQKADGGNWQRGQEVVA
jgi:hypothetical protein